MSSVPEFQHKLFVIAVAIKPTIVNGGGVQVVALNDKENKAKSLSIYLRLSDGSESWVADHPITSFGQSIDHGARLSMYYGVPLDPVPGFDVHMIHGGNPDLVGERWDWPRAAAVCVESRTQVTDGVTLHIRAFDASMFVDSQPTYLYIGPKPRR